MSVSGKIAIVTGAGKGIGKSIAQVFAREGAKVVVATRTAATGQETVEEIIASGGEAVLFNVDLGGEADVLALLDFTVSHYGGVDIIVHNAAAALLNKIEDLPSENLDKTLNVNLKTAFWLAKYSLPQLRQRGGGRLLFTSSVTGPHTCVEGAGAYAASKAGLNGFIRAAAFEFAADNITVNGVEPGVIKTPALGKHQMSELMWQRMQACIPMGRAGSPRDIAETMLFLASEGAGYITGQTIVVDGGALLPENGAFMLEGL